VEYELRARMCAPRPKLPDTFSVDDLVKKGERERGRERGEGGGGEHSVAWSARHSGTKVRA